MIRWVIGRLREFKLVSLNCYELFMKVNANLKYRTLKEILSFLLGLDMLEMLRNWINH